MNSEKEISVEKKPSQMKARVKVQEMIEKHTRNAIGRFHAKEFNERLFVDELFKNFTLTPKDVGNKV